MNTSEATGRPVLSAAARAALWLLNDLPAALEGALYPDPRAQGLPLTPADLAAVSQLELTGNADGSAAAEPLPRSPYAEHGSCGAGASAALLRRTASAAASASRGASGPVGAVHTEL